MEFSRIVFQYIVINIAELPPENTQHSSQSKCFVDKLNVFSDSDLERTFDSYYVQIIN